MPGPKPWPKEKVRSVVVSIAITPEIKRLLTADASSRDTTVSTLAALLIRAHYERLGGG